MNSIVSLIVTDIPAVKGYIRAGGDRGGSRAGW